MLVLIDDFTTKRTEFFDVFRRTKKTNFMLFLITYRYGNLKIKIK